MVYMVAKTCYKFCFHTYDKKLVVQVQRDTICNTENN